MKFFTRSELISVLVIMTLLTIVSVFNLRVSLRRARDAQRISDVNAIVDAIAKFGGDFGFYPPSSEDGRILACKGDNYDAVVASMSEDDFNLAKYFEGLRPCNWGEDVLTDLSDATYKPYLDKIPSDPGNKINTNYLYISNSNHFQVFAHLEGGASESQYKPEVENRNLACGSQICNFGNSLGATPLDKTLEQYENELLQKSKDPQNK